MDSASVDAPPDRMLNSGLSDQSVVVMVAQRRMVQARSRRTYPQQVYRSGSFAEAHLALERQADLDALSAFAALAHRKDLIGEAARIAHARLCCAPTSAAASVALQAAARAICRGETRLVRELVRECAVVAEHTVDDGQSVRRCSFFLASSCNGQICGSGRGVRRAEG